MASTALARGQTAEEVLDRNLAELLQERQRRKQQLVAFADGALVVGLALLLLGIAAAVLLVLDVVLGRWPAVACCAFVIVLGAVVWYLLPLRQRRRSDG